MNICVSRDRSGALDKVYLVFHEAGKSRSAIIDGLKWSHPGINFDFIDASQMHSEELSRFMLDQIGCLPLSANLFSALAST